MAEQSEYERHFLKPKYRGKLRDSLVSIGGKIKQPVSEQEFSDFFGRLNGKMAKIQRNDLDAILRLAAQSHLEYEKLRPFVDGNGRTGRLIVNYILGYFSYPPFVFTSDAKNDYYECFQIEDIDDTSKMEKYFLEKYKEDI